MRIQFSGIPDRFQDNRVAYQQQHIVQATQLWLTTKLVIFSFLSIQHLWLLVSTKVMSRLPKLSLSFRSRGQYLTVSELSCSLHRDSMTIYWNKRSILVVIFNLYL